MLSFQELKIIQNKAPLTKKVHKNATPLTTSPLICLLLKATMSLHCFFNTFDPIGNIPEIKVRYIIYYL